RTREIPCPGHGFWRVHQPGPLAPRRIELTPAGRGGHTEGDRRGGAGRAVRRDRFNRFRDATSVRASLLGQIGGGFSLAGSYAEGIAQPTFFDLYGFFPRDFAGNQRPKPASSRAF